MTDMSFAAQRPAPPEPDALGLDPRLMTPERLLGLAGQHRMRIGIDAQDCQWLDCIECGRGLVQLTGGPGGGRIAVTAMGILTAMLRHQVMRHELPLSASEV